MGKIKILPPGSSLPEGAVQIHLYPAERMLKPRGSMEKESLGETILERLQNSFEYWTDPKYGDRLTREEAARHLLKNLQDEQSAAWGQFVLNNGLVQEVVNIIKEANAWET